MAIAFIDAHRVELGVELVSGELAIAPSSYRSHTA